MIFEFKNATAVKGGETLFSDVSFVAQPGDAVAVTGNTESRKALLLAMLGMRPLKTICGTGTEDYFGGSWSFAKQVDGKTVEQNYCTPYLGYPYYSSHDELIHNFYHNDDVMPMRGFYRWHIQDPICFDEDLKVTIQQIGVGYRGLFERQDDVASVAYWYQAEPHNSFPELPGKEERWPR